MHQCFHRKYAAISLRDHRKVTLVVPAAQQCLPPRPRAYVMVFSAVGGRAAAPLAVRPSSHPSPLALGRSCCASARDNRRQSRVTVLPRQRGQPTSASLCLRTYLLAQYAPCAASPHWRRHMVLWAVAQSGLLAVPGASAPLRKRRGVYKTHIKNQRSEKQL